MTGGIKSAELLATGGKLKAEVTGDHVEIAVPAEAPDKIDSVIELKIKGEPQVETPPTLHKPAQASSEDGDNKAGNAFDADQKTHWSAAPDQRAGWLQVDLGKPVQIGATMFTEPDKAREQRGITYQIQYQDGDAWKTAVEGKTSGRGDQKSFTPVTAQVWRLNITEAKGVPAISEWELYEE